MRNFYIVLGFILATGFVHSLCADTVVLKNGKRIEGEILDQGEDYLKVKARSGGVEIYPSEAVESFKKDPVPVAPTQEKQAQEVRKSVTANQSSGTQGNNPDNAIIEQIKGMFQSNSGSPLNGAMGNNPAQNSANPGPYDGELNALSGNMNNIIQQYQQGIANALSSVKGGPGAIPATNPSDAAASIVKQYQGAMSDFDKASQSYQQKK